jgi:regulator of protease activity HflC (stomatin/prohibitin superfamily)
LSTILLILGILLVVAGIAIPKEGLDGTPTPKRGIKAAGGVIGVLGLILSSFYIVPAGHAGVLTQFGAVKGSLSEGPHLVVPVVQRVQQMEVRTQKIETKGMRAASKDMQTVTADLASNFHITNPSEVYQKLGMDYRARIIDPVQHEVLKAVTAQYSADELLKLRSKIKSEVESTIAERLRVHNIIIETNGVSITNFDFSEEYNKAIERKQVAQQEAEQQKYALQKAKLEAETAVTTAKGRAEAARINALSLEAKGGEKLLLREWIEAWKAGGSQVPTFIGSGGNTMFMMDMNSLKKSTDTSGAKKS